MTVTTTRLTVSPEVAISSGIPLPADERGADVIVTVPRQRRSIRDIAVHHAPWDNSVSPRREDLYDNEGRLR